MGGIFEEGLKTTMPIMLDIGLMLNIATLPYGRDDHLSFIVYGMYVGLFQVVHIVLFYKMNINGYIFIPCRVWRHAENVSEGYRKVAGELLIAISEHFSTGEVWKRVRSNEQSWSSHMLTKHSFNGFQV